MNGLILVDKEKGITSRDVVNEIGKIFHTKRVGHTGTLDPLATGLLVIAINDGLKIINLMVHNTKEYIVEVEMGKTTDTLDITGNILKEDMNFSVAKDEIIKVLNSFAGKMLQEVPIYSAVRVNGKRLYEYARNNESVNLPSREIEIFDIEFISMFDNKFSFRVLVSKGTYIRSLVRDIGEKLNICMSMSNLRRTKIGDYSIEDSYAINDIKNNQYSVMSIEKALKNYFTIEVDLYLYNKIINGCLLENIYNQDLIVFKYNTKVIALYQVYDKDNSKIKPVKVINQN